MVTFRGIKTHRVPASVVPSCSSSTQSAIAERSQQISGDLNQEIRINFFSDNQIFSKNRLMVTATNTSTITSVLFFILVILLVSLSFLLLKALDLILKPSIDKSSISSESATILPSIITANPGSSTFSASRFQNYFDLGSSSFSLSNPQMLPLELQDFFLSDQHSSQSVEKNWFSPKSHFNVDSSNPDQHFTNPNLTFSSNLSKFGLSQALQPIFPPPCTMLFLPDKRDADNHSDDSDRATTLPRPGKLPPVFVASPKSKAKTELDYRLIFCPFSEIFSLLGEEVPRKGERLTELQRVGGLLSPCADPIVPHQTSPEQKAQRVVEPSNLVGVFIISACSLFQLPRKKAFNRQP